MFQTLATSNKSVSNAAMSNEIKGAKAFSKVCSGSTPSRTTIWRAFGGADWLAGPLRACPSSVSAWWSKHVAEVSEHNAEGGKARRRFSDGETDLKKPTDPSSGSGA
jgi:hypothetical protein